MEQYELLSSTLVSGNEASTEMKSEVLPTTVLIWGGIRDYANDRRLALVQGEGQPFRR